MFRAVGPSVRSWPIPDRRLWGAQLQQADVRSWRLSATGSYAKRSFTIAVAVGKARPWDYGVRKPAQPLQHGGLPMPDQKNKLEKQEALPFPPTPSGSIAGRTMQESVYRPRATPRRLPADAPNILIVLIDDAGPALPATFGGEVLTPTMDRIVNDGIAYKPLPHYGDVFAHPGGVADWAQSSSCRQRANRRTGERLGRLFRRDPPQQCAGGGGAEGLRLRDGRLGQVAQHTCGGNRPGRSVRELADRPRLRVFLRLSRRRGLAIRAEPGAQHDERPAAKNRARRVSPQRRPGGRRDRLAAQAPGVPARQAVLHVLGERCDPRPAPHREGVGRQI